MATDTITLAEHLAIKADLLVLKTEFRAELSRFRSELAEFRAELRFHRWALALILALVLAVLGKVW